MYTVSPTFDCFSPSPPRSPDPASLSQSHPTLQRSAFTLGSICFWPQLATYHRTSLAPSNPQSLTPLLPPCCPHRHLTFSSSLLFIFHLHAAVVLQPESVNSEFSMVNKTPLAYVSLPLYAPLRPYGLLCKSHASESRQYTSLINLKFA